MFDDEKSGITLDQCFLPCPPWANFRNVVIPDIVHEVVGDTKGMYVGWERE